jgi:phage terminase small subunit
MQDEFVASYVANAGNATQAAISAGYSPKSARQIGGRLTKNPTVQRMIRDEQQRLIGGRLASLALGVLEQVMMDTEAPYGARVDAAKTVLDRAGLPAVPAALIASGHLIEGKPMQQMSKDELQDFIAKGTAELKRIQSARLVENQETVDA